MSLFFHWWKHLRNKGKNSMEEVVKDAEKEVAALKEATGEEVEDCAKKVLGDEVDTYIPVAETVNEISDIALKLLTYLSDLKVNTAIAHSGLGTAFVRLSMSMGFSPDMMKIQLDSVLKSYTEFWKDNLDKKEEEKPPEIVTE